MYHDTPGIDLSIMVNKLNEDLDARPIKQKRQLFNPERYVAINTEIQKLLEASLIQEAYYSDWLANIFLVKKTNRKWRVCIDFAYLNRACLQDCFPLP